MFTRYIVFETISGGASHSIAQSSAASKKSTSTGNSALDAAILAADSGSGKHKKSSYAAPTKAAVDKSKRTSINSKVKGKYEHDFDPDAF